MSDAEAQNILIESLLHSQETKVDYFRNKSNEFKIEPQNFIDALLKGYNQLNDYVNKPNRIGSWGVDEATGKRIYHKQTLNLYQFNPNLTGWIDHENIAEILTPGLIKYVEYEHNNLNLEMIKINNELIKNKTLPIEDMPTNSTITKRQAVLLFDYIFNELKAEQNATKRSELISFVTGLNAEKLRQAHSKKGSDNYNQDLQTIRTFFENLKLDSIVQKINKEIANEVK